MAAPQGVLGPIVVQMGYGEAAWGWALAVLMIGFMAGGLVTLRWMPRHALYVGTAFLTLTACFPAALAANLNLGLVLTGAFLHGFGLELFSVAWDLSIQGERGPDKLARVYGFDVLGSFIARPIGLALTGPLAEPWGMPTGCGSSPGSSWSRSSSPSPSVGAEPRTSPPGGPTTRATAPAPPGNVWGCPPNRPCIGSSRP